MDYSLLKQRILTLEKVLQIKKYRQIDISTFNYQEMCNLLIEFYNNTLIIDGVIKSISFQNLMNEEKKMDSHTLQLFYVRNNICKEKDISKDNLNFINDILNNHSLENDVSAFRCFIDTLIDLYFYKEDKNIKGLIYDLISKYLSLEVLSKKMIKFYIRSAVIEDNIHLLDVRFSQNSISKTRALANYYSTKKRITINLKVIEQFFCDNQISYAFYKNRYFLAIVEHELDHAYVKNKYFPYNVLNNIKHKENREYFYLKKALALEEYIRGNQISSLYPTIYYMSSEHRADTFGYLKSLWRLRKHYGRFIELKDYHFMYGNTIRNIVNHYSYKKIAPFLKEDEINIKLYHRNKKLKDFKEEFIPDSFEQTKKLFNELFDGEDFSEEVLKELHRIMIGDKVKYNEHIYNQDISATSGGELLASILEETERVYKR